MTPLNIIILWHMHQPYYKDPETGRFIMPWVRLHAIKDYYDMVDILKDFPTLKVNFNLVPSLLQQIEEYASGETEDTYLEISKKHPAELSPSEKLFIIRNFFMANESTMINPHPRYKELLQKRGGNIEEVDKSSKHFTNQDILDLQVWFNLSWFDPIHIERDPFLRALIEKGRGFTQEEKERVLKKQIEIVKMIIPKYREMAEKGVIELSVSPFYHPILPLLCDSYSAKEALPEIKLPKRFRYPEDAATQLRMAVEYFEGLFDHRPYGCWPPEGGVSDELMSILIKEGFRWTATDEGILAHSIGEDLSRNDKGLCKKCKVLYKPYFIERQGRRIIILFRDRILSDLIGFVYRTWDPEDAANDLIRRLNQIWNQLKLEGANPEKHVVSIILDGENPWEYYKNDGKDFLERLYGKFEEAPYLKTVTVTELLEGMRIEDRIERLFAGSWVDSNFKIWIGHEEDNRAWEYLGRARRVLVKSEGLPEKIQKEAWDSLYIAEGSDWFWWYGDEHHSPLKGEFDKLFRKNLKRIYTLTGTSPPPSIEIPIYKEKEIVIERPKGLLNPSIDGEVTSYFEWLPAGKLEKEDFGGAMHQLRGYISALYYGFSLENLYLRIDHEKDLLIFKKGKTLNLNILTPEELKIVLSFDRGQLRLLSKGRELGSFAVGRIIEIQIPFKKLGAKEGDMLSFFITIEKAGIVCERWPHRGYISLTVPGKDFEAWNWFV